jgi:hypothetical protein
MDEWLGTGQVLKWLIPARGDVPEHFGNARASHRFSGFRPQPSLLEPGATARGVALDGAGGIIVASSSSCATSPAWASPA